jgi:hypothetical protein
MDESIPQKVRRTYFSPEARIYISRSVNKLNVQQFLKKVKAVHEKHGTFPPHRIYNVETGLSTVHVPPKMVAPKGIKQLGSMASGER